MKGISYITTDNGIKTGILLDLQMMREKKKHQHDLDEYLEELTDLIYIELHKDDETLDWEAAKKQLKASNKLSRHV